MKNLCIVLMLAVVLAQVSNVKGDCKGPKGPMKEGATFPETCYTCTCTGTELVCDGKYSCPFLGRLFCITKYSQLKKGVEFPYYGNTCQCKGSNLFTCA